MPEKFEKDMELIHARDDAELTQFQAAIAIGKHLSTIQFWERGRTKIPPVYRKKLYEVYDAARLLLEGKTGEDGE